MSTHMPKSEKEERLRWVLPIARKEMRVGEVAKVFPHGKRTLERWVAAYRRSGEEGLEPKSTAPKHHRRETPIRIKERVIEMRKETKLCAQKLHWRLEKEGIMLHPRTIGKILKREGLTRRYRVKRIKYKYLKAEMKLGDLVEIDVKYVPGEIAGKRYFQYTAIDRASRWRHLAVYDEQSTWHSIRFLREVMDRFPYQIKAIKTDNHSTFTNWYTGMTRRSDMTVKTIHALDRFCAARGIVHYLIDPGKPAQNGTVERSHREDQEKFYDLVSCSTFEELRYRLHLWNLHYNDLEHCGIGGKTPNEMLRLQTITSPPDVGA